MECVRPRFNKGIPPVTNSGRHKAKRTILGKSDVKNVDVSDSVRTCKIREATEV